MVNKIIDSVTAALADVQDGSTVLIGGFGDAGVDVKSARIYLMNATLSGGPP